MVPLNCTLTSVCYKCQIIWLPSNRRFHELSTQLTFLRSSQGQYNLRTTVVKDIQLYSPQIHYSYLMKTINTWVNLHTCAPLRTAPTLELTRWLYICVGVFTFVTPQPWLQPSSAWMPKYPCDIIKFSRCIYNCSRPTNRPIDRRSSVFVLNWILRSIHR